MSKRISSLFTSGTPPEERRASETGPSFRPRSPKKTSPTRGRLQSPARLKKAAANTTSKSRSASQPYLASTEPTLPNIEEPSLRELRQNSLTELGPLQPPPAVHAGLDSRSSSRDRSRPGTSRTSAARGSRPATPTLQVPGLKSSTPTSPAGESSDTQKKKHWWSKSNKKDDSSSGPAAWIAGHPQALSYDVEGLVNARPAQELWDYANGNCFVYLFPRTSGKAASFKVDSAIFASSPVLTKLAVGEIYSNGGATVKDRKQVRLNTRTSALSLNDPSTPPASPKRSLDRASNSSHEPRGRQSASSDGADVHLYLPIKLSSDAALNSTPPRSDEAAAMEDTQTLVDYRNMFAFLCGQSLVATERRNTFFSIFMTIAGILKSYQFSNVDGSNYGEVANASFDNYVEELGLADVRSGREKTIESIVLGERMKSVFLYNEAFTHGVGKHSELLAIKSSRFNHISPITQNRLIRADMDLQKRTASIRLILTDFEFPALFSGIMNSKTSEERKLGVRFDQWKESFLGMRKFVIGLYKDRYGDWPPKASNKKNSLETSGLNRLVLRDVYHDLSSLYDLLVDRNSLTTRTIDGFDLGGVRNEPNIRGLRAILSEYDRSTPPVKPPVPFDLPMIPTLRSTRTEFGTGDPKKNSKDLSKKIKDDESAKVLRASWNSDAIVTPFVDAFRDMEKRAAHGCNIVELEDLRIGQWIFLYAVLQALPMLACDAPGLKWTKGVEYFLCEPPRSGVPWADASATGAGRRTWFSVGGEGGGVVSWPSDVVEHGVEGIYHRSHCWRMAEQWSANNPALNEALHEQHHTSDPMLNLPVPPTSHGARRPDSRSSSRSVASKRMSTLGIGLEALPLPAGINPDGGAPSAPQRPRTPAHAVDSSKTFDAILANVDSGKSKKKNK